MNEDPFQHDWIGQTVLHPLGLAAVILLGIMMLILPRRWAMLPMIMLACFVAPAQRVMIFGCNFTLLRLLVAVGWTRVLLHAETRGFVWKTMDCAAIALAATSAITYSLLLGTPEALKYKLGESFDALGMYFLFRCLVRSWDDLDRAVRIFVITSVPVAVAFVIERCTGRNAFAFLGGVPEITVVREGRLRCQGAFAHPILAGCFWASLTPLFVAGWWAGTRQRLEAVVGTMTSLLIVILCASSTPVSGVAVAVMGACMFPFRRQMHLVRWGVLGSLVALHMIMNAPVWHLISRIDLAGGSTSYHRYVLIDQAIRRFGEWWLVGTKSTAHWGWDMYDVTNQYVLVGVEGGILTLVFFVGVIALGFRGIGVIWRGAGSDRYRVTTAWALGVSLFVHCVCFFAVSYFGQILMVWYLLLAAISSLTPPNRRVTWSRVVCAVRNVERRVKPTASRVGAPRIPPELP